VNVLLTEFETARETVYESHPEVCFTAYYGDDLPPKDTVTGFETRKECLIKHGGESFQPIVDLADDRHTNSCWHHRIQSGRVDDVLDAAVLTLTARDSTGSHPTLPAGADPTCEPSIVYPST